MKAIPPALQSRRAWLSEEQTNPPFNITKCILRADGQPLLTAFQMRSITVDELIGFREALMETRLLIDFAPCRPIDIVGTGGDGKNTFNISTCACFVVAGAGYKVAKHGNYGATSVSGSQQCHRAARRTLHQQPRHAETQHGVSATSLTFMPSFSIRR